MPYAARSPTLHWPPMDTGLSPAGCDEGVPFSTETLVSHTPFFRGQQVLLRCEHGELAPAIVLGAKGLPGALLALWLPVAKLYLVAAAAELQPAYNYLLFDYAAPPFQPGAFALRATRTGAEEPVEVIAQVSAAWVTVRVLCSVTTFDSDARRLRIP